MPKLFISYRRSDSQAITDRIYDRLRQTFGARQIFKDTVTIPAGVDFRHVVEQDIASADVVLAIIGQSWATVANADGTPRLHDPDDFVRGELALALAARRTIVPVLVQGAAMPADDALPDVLKPLVYLNALSVRNDPDFERDMAHLIATVRRPTDGNRRRVRLALAGLTAISVLVMVVLAVNAPAWLAVVLSPQLCLSGSSTLTPLIDAWLQDSDTALDRVRVAPVGVARAVEAAANGTCLNVLYAVAPLTAEQEQTLETAGVDVACAAVAGYDLLAAVTHISNKVPVLNTQTVGPVLAGEVTNWSVLRGADTPLRLLYDPSSPAMAHLLDAFALSEDDLLRADRTHVVTCENEADCFDQLLRTPGSLYFVSARLLQQQPTEFMRVLPVLNGDERPLNPLARDFELSEYPSWLISPILVYGLTSERTTDEQAALLRRFVTGTVSMPGQQEVNQQGYYSSYQYTRVSAPPYPASFDATAIDAGRVCE